MRLDDLCLLNLKETTFCNETKFHIRTRICCLFMYFKFVLFAVRFDGKLVKHFGRGLIGERGGRKCRRA